MEEATHDTTEVQPRRGWKRFSVYAESLLAVIFLAYVQHNTNLIEGDRPRYTLMLIGTCYAVWRGGRGPGVFALVTSIVISDWVLTDPMFSFSALGFGDALGLTLLLVVGTFIIVLGDAQRRDRNRALRREKELTVVNDQLATAQAALAEALARRASELSELKRFVAEEDLVPAPKKPPSNPPMF